MSKSSQSLKFIDLFAGIGGFHMALAQHQGECVFVSEWDKFAQQTYAANFKDKILGDITKIKESEVPDHDVLCGGFPCQAFSISGKQKGFEDTRGTLFFDIMRIARYKKPKMMLLENVKNLTKHDKGKTLKVILNTLDKEGYDVFYEVLNASDYGVPQARKRVYFVCFRKDLGIKKFEFPKKEKKIITLESFLLDPNDKRLKDLFIDRKDFKLNKKDETPNNKPIQIGAFSKGRQGERIYSIKGHAITLSAQGGGIAGKTGAYLIKGKIRQLHPIECARIQGFPEGFKIPVSTAQAWKQFGNSVAVPVLSKIYQKMLKAIKN